MLAEIAYWGMGAAVEAAFLSGYQAERPLSSAEQAALPMLQGVRSILALGIPSQHVDTWRRTHRSDAIIDKQLTLIAQAMNGG